MKRLIVLVQIVLLVGLSSCSKDFLEKRPPAVVGADLLYTPSGVEAMLTGTYAIIHGDGQFGGALCTDWTYGSARADDAYKGTEEGDQLNFNLIERYQCLPDNPYVAERWRDCYNIVFRANQTLDFLDITQAGSNPITDANRVKQIQAEAKFLRAWAHFQAQKTFRNIPYIKTVTEMDGMPGDQVPNSGPVWSDIEADLQVAINDLPDTFAGAPGRATKWAATAVKAHAHMYQSEFSDAKPLLDAIIDSGRFSLVKDYFDNFSEYTENNSESIFEIQAFSAPGYVKSVRIAGAVFPQAGGPAVGGWGFYQPSQVLVEAFQVTEDGLPILDINKRPEFKNDMGLNADDDFVLSDQLIDPRLDWTVARRGVDYLGWGIATPGISRMQSNGGPYMTKKFLHFESSRNDQNGSGFQNNRNFRMYRLSHVILWRAEIAVEEGEFDKARELVNQIRNRAKGSAVVMGVCAAINFKGETSHGYDDVDMTKPAGNYKVEPYPADHAAFASIEEARKAVRQEIQLEFATEGHRFFDLRRWGIDIEVLNDYIAKDITFRNFMTGAKYEEADRWLPIPQLQIDIRQGVLVQDPQY